MKQGDELCWCYSAHDNDAAWLLNYGFVPSDGVSSHPTLPPHVLAEFPSPSSSTDSTGSTSSHESNSDTESDDVDSEASFRDGLAGVQTLDSEEEPQSHVEGDVGLQDGHHTEGQSASASGPLLSGQTPKDVTMSDSRLAENCVSSASEIVRLDGGLQTTGGGGEPESVKEAVPSLVAATQHLQELGVAMEGIKAWGPDNCTQGILTLLQRERDALEGLMKASMLAVAEYNHYFIPF